MTTLVVIYVRRWRRRNNSHINQFESMELNQPQVYGDDEDDEGEIIVYSRLKNQTKMDDGIRTQQQHILFIFILLII